MAQVYLNIGSNIERHAHICAGLDALAQQFGKLELSSVYESEAVGFVGAPFYNLAVALHTDMSVTDLARWLRRLEYKMGREPGASRFSSRTLDIDILSYDKLVGEFEGVSLPRAEILKNAHVLAPLAELAPWSRHPVLGTSYGELWEDYDKAAQSLSKVDFEWRGRLLSES